MFIEKDGKYYEIAEHKKYWSVVLKTGVLTADFQVSKEICPTENELREYVKSEKTF